VTMQRRLFQAPRPGDEPTPDIYYLRTIEAKARREPSSGSDEDVYEVERILKEDEATGRFLIRWEGFSPEDDTWEPEENIAPPLVHAFRHRRDLLRVNAGDDCTLGRVKMLWCSSCAEHQPSDSFSVNQRRLAPASRVCLNHHYRTEGPRPHRSASMASAITGGKAAAVYATPAKRERDDDTDLSPPPPPRLRRVALPLARSLDARHADLEVSRCRLHGMPSSL